MVFGQAPAAGSGIDKLLPYGIGVLLLLAVVLWFVRAFFGEWAKKAGDRSFSRLFPGRGRVGGRRLRDYRRSVQADYGKHVLGFFSTETIDIRTVYVPLQYVGNERRQDVYERIRSEPRSVVVGPAGAGKSLLLKNSMLIWAATEPSGRRPHVPVMVDLHRCNTGELGLVDLIVGELSRGRLHRRQDTLESFVRTALEEGCLRLLFDGLDEVGRDNQDRVVRELRDLARTYPDCQMVVTCRTAVYHGQLAPEFGHVVQVAEFDDASVRRLLGNWPGIHDAGGPDRLFDLLRRNPSLMRLARSPLLLTMMAYLHVEGLAKTGRTLPNSRAEFYEKAIAHLLGRDVDLGRGRALTVYGVGEKLAALQRIALALQEVPPAEAVDRLSMSRADLLAAIGTTLPELNLDSGHAKPLLDEIVDRSQLLVPLDRSNWLYQFRHLTMQEYLAARELAGDPARLMAHYRADPDAWRETVKLWCADGRDCTTVVREVFAADKPRHKVLALECLADATRISVELADEVIEHFIRRLNVGGDEGDAVIRGFGAVAADSRPRGNKVMERLTELTRSRAKATRSAAYRALAASGRVEAARVLAPLAPNDPNARAALRGMGELAIPVLAEHAANRSIWAVDNLAQIGTPAAAEALSQRLWSDHDVAFRAAWRLAELVRNPDIEEALGRVEVPPADDVAFHDWVWLPFAADSPPALQRIAGRIAQLIDTSAAELIPEDAESVDTRIGLPLAALRLRGKNLYQYEFDDRTKKLVRAFADEQDVRIHSEPYGYHATNAYLKAGALDGPSRAARALTDALLERWRIAPGHQRLVELLIWPVRAQVLARVVLPGATLSRQSWIAVLEKPRSSDVLWRLAWLAAGLLIAGIAGIGGYLAVTVATGSWRFGPLWVAAIAAGGFGMVIYSVVAHTREVLSYLYPRLTGGRRGGGLAGQLRAWRRRRELRKMWPILDDAQPTRTWNSLVAYRALTEGSVGILVYGIGLAVITGGDWVSWVTIGLVLVGAVAPAAATLARRRDRNRSNVLRDCLAADRQARLGRRSVIASA